MPHPGQSIEPFNPQKSSPGDAESAKILQFFARYRQFLAYKFNFGAPLTSPDDKFGGLNDPDVPLWVCPATLNPFVTLFNMFEVAVTVFDHLRMFGPNMVLLGQKKTLFGHSCCPPVPISGGFT